MKSEADRLHESGYPIAARFGTIVPKERESVDNMSMQTNQANQLLDMAGKLRDLALTLKAMSEVPNQHLDEAGGCALALQIIRRMYFDACANFAAMVQPIAANFQPAMHASQTPYASQMPHAPRDTIASPLPSHLPAGPFSFAPPPHPMSSPPTTDAALAMKVKQLEDVAAQQRAALQGPQLPPGYAIPVPAAGQGQVTQPSEPSPDLPPAPASVPYEPGVRISRAYGGG